MHGNGNNMLPCILGRATNVTSSQQSVFNDDALSMQCAQDLNMEYNTTSTPFVLQCKTHSDIVLNGLEPGFLKAFMALYVLIAVFRVAIASDCHIRKVQVVDGKKN